MSPAEAEARTLVATQRIGNGGIAHSLVLLGYFVARLVMYLILHLCIGFGAAALAGQSAWWGLPLAFLSSQSIGRIVAVASRASNVRALEAMADEVEKQKGGRP